MEVLSRDVLWCPSKQQLVYQWFDAEGNVILQQGRNFHPMAKQKCQTYGSPEDVLPIYYRATKASDTETSVTEETIGKEEAEHAVHRLVIVEDPLSAIKIARQSDCMPCLGSDLSRTKLKRLVRLYGAFLVWLDSDMYKNAQRMARRLEFLGAEARAVWTPLDPKRYSDTQICNMLLTNTI